MGHNLDGSSAQGEELEVVAGVLVEADRDCAEVDHADPVVATAEDNYWEGHYDQGLESHLVVLYKVLDYADCIGHLEDPVSVEGHCNHFDVSEKGHCVRLSRHLLGGRYCASADMEEAVDTHTEGFVEDIHQKVAPKEEEGEEESCIAAHQP